MDEGFTEFVNRITREWNALWESRIAGILEDLLGRIPTNEELREYGEFISFTYCNWMEFRWKGVTLLYRPPLIEWESPAPASRE